MNRIRPVMCAIRGGYFAMLLLVQGNFAFAADNDCWADFFEGAQYSGKHFVVKGAAQLKNLNKVNGENWDSRIDSLKTGPKTKVIVYQNPDFKLTAADMVEHPDLMHSMGLTEKDVKEDSELIFNANAKIHDLSDFNFRQKVRSLKVECQ